MYFDNTEVLQRALQYIPPASLSYDEWVNVGMAMKQEGLSCNDWCTWSSKDSRYNERDCVTTWESFHGGNITGGTIVHIAKQYGYDPDSNTEYIPPRSEPKATKPAAESLEEIEERKKQLEVIRNKVVASIKAYKGSKAESYAKERGFTEETAKRFNFGYDQKTNGLLIPYPKECYYITRKIDVPQDATGGKKCSKPTAKNGITEPLFGLPLVSGDTVYIVEGQLDAITLYQSGVEAVAIGGKGKEKLNDLKEKGIKKAVIVGDNDKLKEGQEVPDGTKNAEDIARKLDSLGIANITVYLPEGLKDPNYALIHKPDVLKEHIAKWKEKAEAMEETKATAEARIQFDDIKIYSASELLKTEFPPDQWIVEGILPVGVTVLAAPPKSYKSFFALDLCLSVSQGLPFLGRPTNKASCIYCDLESGAKRTKSRINTMMEKNPEIIIPDNLFIINEAKHIGQLHRDFKQRLYYILENIAPDTKLLIIDVFKLITPPRKKTVDMYEALYEDIGALKEIVKEKGLCILLITHTGKMKDPSDPFNNIMGSSGLFASIDTAYVIDREKRTDSEATLYLTGKDIVDNEPLKMEFDKNAMRWKYSGTLQEADDRKAKESFHDNKIMTAIKKLVEMGAGCWSGSVQDLVSDARRYHNIYIDKASNIIGKELQKQENISLLESEYGIMTRYEAKQTKREYKFMYPDYYFGIPEESEEVQQMEIEPEKEENKEE